MVLDSVPEIHRLVVAMVVLLVVMVVMVVMVVVQRDVFLSVVVNDLSSLWCAFAIVP